jgi:hypothetical protein
MNRKEFITELGNLRNSSYKQYNITVTHKCEYDDSDEKTFTVNFGYITGFCANGCAMKTNCASTEIFGFTFNPNLYRNPNAAIKLCMDYYLSLIHTPFYIFSDSARNNKIYPYIDMLYKGRKNYTVVENPTIDKHSTIKTVIYSKSV